MALNIKTPFLILRGGALWFFEFELLAHIQFGGNEDRSNKKEGIILRDKRVSRYNRFLHYAGANNEPSRIWNIRLCDKGEFSAWQPGRPEP